MNSAPLTRLFAQPGLLWLLLLALLAALLLWRAARLRRRGLALMAGALPQRRFAQVRAGVRRWRGMLFVSGLLYLGWACAGPRWGARAQANVASDQDLAIVLDLSRSMEAEQPSRRERAVRSLRHLADAFQQRGGRRVSLVVFAAQARLVFPLTQDYDHWRSVLSQIAEGDIPSLAASADEPLASGTRIGAGLKLALASHDPQRVGRQAVLLVSDGDDPAGDEEWQHGVQEAKALRVPVHVVGVGDPLEASTIPHGSDVLRFAGQPVRTKAEEDVLREIARRSGGVYLPAPAGALKLGALLPPILDQRPVGDDETAGAFAEPQPRHAWFLLAALACFAATLLLNEGPRPVETWKAPRGAQIAAALGALMMVSAGPLDEDAVRRGNEAFAQQEYAQAVEHYEKAEAASLDPGLVAFNKGVALYRLGRFAEAELSFRCCLDDDQAPPVRRAKACFDLGNSLLRQGSDDSAVKYRLAAEAYRACLLQPDLDADLRKDARHNLELAQVLWLQARAKRPDDPEGNEPNPKPNAKSKTETKNGQGDPAKASKDGVDSKGDPNGTPSKDQGNAPQPGKQIATGPLQALPDDERIQPMSPQDLLLRLEREAQRIATARRAWRVQQSAPHPDGKDW